MPCSFTDDVLRFWFDELRPDDWFTRSERVDALIRNRFAQVYERAKSLRPEAPESPRDSLATVIALDQFPRNMFRGSPQSYATDALAMAVAEHALARGYDTALTTNQRMFLYMPFQHSEQLAAQRRSVNLFMALGDAQALDYARQHLDIIERFGRFPHRNAVLGRPSSHEEQQFLAQHPGF